MKVSVICPTNRPEYHANVYSQFAKQTYPCDLLVLADEPSPFFMKTSDTRIQPYYTMRRATIGEKRNTLIQLSDSDVIVHFDDDDYYSPYYVEYMIRALRDSRAGLVKLGTWTWHNILNDTHGVFDGGVTEATRWGYGFSYVYYRDLAIKFPFPYISLREDITFLNRLRENGVRCACVDSMPELVEHKLHGKNTSKFLNVQQTHAAVASLACAAGAAAFWPLAGAAVAIRAMTRR